MVYLKKLFFRISQLTLLTALLLPQHSVLASGNNELQPNGSNLNIKAVIADYNIATREYVDNQVEGVSPAPKVLQKKGWSETAVMSQRAVTRAIEEEAEGAISKLLKSQRIFDLVYPVGSIYMSINSIDPKEIFGGVWRPWGQGRVPLGIGDNGTTNYTVAEAIGGAETVKLDVSQIPSHSHARAIENTVGNTQVTWPAWTITIPWSNEYSEAVTRMSLPSTSTGGDGFHNNMQPYITCYMWTRVE